MSLETAAAVVDLVRAASPDAEAEVVVDTVEQALTRFANSFIHQNVAEASTSVRLRLHVDGRTAAGSSTLIDADGLRALVDRTLAAAALCPPDLQWPGLTAPGPVTDAPSVDEETVAADPAARAARVRAFVTAAGGLETAGYCSTTSFTTAFANSAGQSAAARSALAALDAIARQGLADGVSRIATTRLSELDGAVHGERAAAKARASVDPQELPPGRYEVVMEPSAVMDLLAMLSFNGFNGKAVNERRSFVELGVAQFDPSLSLVDDPLDPAAGGAAFDVEGTPKRRLTSSTPVSAPRSRTTGAAPPWPARRRPGTLCRAAPPTVPSRSTCTCWRPLAAGRSARWKGRWRTRPWPTWWPRSAGACSSPTSGTPACSIRGRWS